MDLNWDRHSKGIARQVDGVTDAFTVNYWAADANQNATSRNVNGFTQGIPYRRVVGLLDNAKHVESNFADRAR